MTHNITLRNEVIKLRTVDALGLKDISLKTGVSKSTLSIWCKNYPLSVDIVSARQKANVNATYKPYYPTKSKLYALIENKNYTPNQLGRISEAAVIHRLTLLGFEVYTSIFDAARIDLIVRTPTKLLKIQVKSTRCQTTTRKPYISVFSTPKRDNKCHKYSENEVDFFIGYDRFTDICYIWKYSETLAHTIVTGSAQSEECWNKLLEIT